MPAISSHAVQRYRERIRDTLTGGEAFDALCFAVAAPLFRLPIREGELLGCLSPDGRRFLAWVVGGVVENVGMPWYWHEAKSAWRNAGYPRRRNAKARQARKDRKRRKSK